MQEKNRRNPQDKQQMPCFMPEKVQTDEDSGSPAQQGDRKECLFRDAPETAARAMLVQAHQDHAQQAHRTGHRDEQTVRQRHRWVTGTYGGQRRATNRISSLAKRCSPFSSGICGQSWPIRGRA